MGNWQSFLLRRLAGRLRVDDEVLRRLAAFSRLPATVGMESPDRVWPFWLERQLDARSADFTPRGDLPFPANVTHRNWTVVGTLDSPGQAIVDPRGLVTPWPGGWSLDWWIGAEDRWHVPGRETAVRQSLLDSTPVVETAMRIPGGDAVHRAYVVAPPGGAGSGEELVIVEVENWSATPVAVAFALRPYNPEGRAVLERIVVDGNTVRVDGGPALLLPRAPAGVAGSTFAGGDSAAAVFAGKAGSGLLPPIHDSAGLAEAAFVYPVPHHTAIRVGMPLRPPPRTAPRRPGTVPPPELAAFPAPADVARGWQAQLRRGLRVHLPDERLEAAVAANRAFLLLLADNGPLGDGDSAYRLSALDRFGFHDEAAAVVRSCLSSSPDGHASGAALWSIAEHHRLTGDRALLEELRPAVRSGARWVARKAREHGRGGAGPRGAFDRCYEDAFWALRGLLDAGWLLRLGGDDAAAGAEAAAGELRAAILRSLEADTGRLGLRLMPAGPGRGVDAGLAGSLVACSPLRLLPPDDPWVAGTLDVIRDRFCLGEAFLQSISHPGLAPHLTLRLAACELEAGDPRAWRRLRWMLDAATPTFTWPEAVHPRLGGGCGGAGHHGRAAAGFLSFVRDVLVREAPDGGLALLTILPPEWAGQEVEVHDAPTHHGRISYAVRWHGDRPALFWECDRPGVALRAPGLDRVWSTTDQAGEALLVPYRRRVVLEVE